MSMQEAEIQSYHFYCDKYKTAGRWVYSDSVVAVVFSYDGNEYRIPFNAIFTKQNIPWLKEAAVMQMEAKIEEIEFGMLSDTCTPSPKLAVYTASKASR